MQFTDFSKLNLQRLPSPCFVVDQVAIERNLKILKRVADASGAKVLAALKAFSMWQLGPLTASYLDGICASGLHEALLGRDEYQATGRPNEVHVYSAAFSEEDLAELLTFADHIVFNSTGQWRRFQDIIEAARAKRPELAFGLRINPEHSEGSVPIYDPCAPGSRLGIRLADLQGQDLSGISGLHFHTLCEQGFAELDRTLTAVEDKFGHLLKQMQWINFGGGHHITVPGYDVAGLIARIKAFADKYSVQVYIEPGEAIAIGTGVLCAQVLDIIESDGQQALLDTSATCHMPDTLEMPYRPDITGAGEVGQFPHNYRLGGLTCLAGDIINDYSFAQPLAIGQRLIFEDMSHYTMVKTSTFNGTKLPAIVLWNSLTDELQVVKEFGYEDFKQRLS
ncbi:MAG: carboxynorspermidine decarboxylase [Pseudomonadales bacterium]|nr:carboxynorspermidine decarboxylase [Pseudomonadales bacterium]NRA18117.1 carboxynorspermidine decarboxylase [Oceanospirillaceae bacterium]